MLLAATLEIYFAWSLSRLHDGLEHVLSSIL